MAGKPPPAEEPKNIVHQYAILSETVAKEYRYQKLFTNYTINPYSTFYAIAPKVNQEEEAGEEDENFQRVIERARMEPGKKYIQPQTEAQEIGWISKPLIDRDKSDRRIIFHRKSTPITQFMEKAWMVKEQQNMGK